MKKNESRERCFQNAMLLMALLNLKVPNRHVNLSVGRTSIELSLFFDKDEKELMDVIVAMLDAYKIDWADYSENYLKVNEIYVAKYTWTIVE